MVNACTTLNVQMVGTTVLNAGMVVSLVSGIVTIATQKQMNSIKSKTCASCSESLFDSPFTQMILGSAAALIIWGIYGVEKKLANLGGADYGRLEFLRTQASLRKGPITDTWVWCLPAVLEVLAGWSYCIALTLTDASTVLLQRSFTVVTTAIVSSVLLQTPIIRGQWIGMVVVTTGIILSVLEAIFLSRTHSLYAEVISATLILLSCAMSSMKMCYEEKLLKENRVAPFQVSGLVGLYCMGICTAILVFWPSKRHELQTSLYQISHSLNLFFITVLFLTSLALFACSSIIVAKFGSSILLNFLRCLRTIAIFTMDKLVLKSSHERLYSDWLPLGVTILGIAMYSVYYPYTIGPPDYPGGDTLVEVDTTTLPTLQRYSSLQLEGETTN